MTVVVISVLADAFQAYCYYLLIQCFFSRSKLSGQKNVLAYFLFFLQITIPHIWIQRAAVTMVCSISACIWMTFTYEGGVKQKVLSGIFAFSAFFLMENIVAALFGYLHLDFLDREEFFSLFGTIVLVVVEYMLVRLFRNFKNIRSGQELPALYWVISLLLPLFSIILYVLYYKQVNWTQLELVVFVGILFLINVFVFFLYDSQIHKFLIQKENEELELQNRYQLHQLQLMNEMGESQRKIRHDMLKHISMLSYLHHEGKNKEMEAYIEEMQQNINLQQCYVETGNYVLDSILNYKMQEAAHRKIQMEITAAVPEHQPFSAYDMNILLSNLLDNAMEAVAGIEEKKISVGVRFSHHKLYLQIKNPYKNLRLDPAGELATTKEEEKEHGYGMKIVRQVVEKYDGWLEIGHDHQMFDVRICLFLKDGVQR